MSNFLFEIDKLIQESTSAGDTQFFRDTPVLDVSKFNVRLMREKFRVIIKVRQIFFFRETGPTRNSVYETRDAEYVMTRRRCIRRSTK